MKPSHMLKRVVAPAALAPLVLAAAFIFAVHIALVHWADILYHDDPYLLHKVIDNEPNYYLTQNLFLFYRETLYATMGRYSGYFLPKFLILIQAALVSVVFYFVARRTFRFSKITAAVGAILPWVLPIQAQIFFSVNSSYVVLDVLFIGIAFLLIDNAYRNKHFTLPFVLLLVLLIAFTHADRLAFAYMPLPLLFFGYQDWSELKRRWWRVLAVLAAVGAAAFYSYLPTAAIRQAYIDRSGLSQSLDPAAFLNELAAMFGYMSPYVGSHIVNQWFESYALGAAITISIIVLAFVFAIANHGRAIGKDCQGRWLGMIGRAVWLRDFRIMSMCLIGILYFFLFYTLGSVPQARYVYPSSYFFGPMFAYVLVSVIHLMLARFVQLRFRHVAVGVLSAALLGAIVMRKEEHAHATHFPEVFLYHRVVSTIPPDQLAMLEGIVVHSKWTFIQHSGIPYLTWAKLWYAASRVHGRDVVIPRYGYVDSDNTCQAIFRGQTPADPWGATQMNLERDKRYLFFRAETFNEMLIALPFVANSDLQTSTFEVLDMSQSPTRVVLTASSQQGLIDAVTAAEIDPTTIANMPEPGMTCLTPPTQP